MRKTVPLVVAVAIALVAAPSAHAYLYWANDGGSTIGRAALDRSSVKQDFITGVTNPCDLAVDSGHIYWDNITTGTIGRANIDGSNPDQNFITGQSGVCGIAVNSTHIYWGYAGKIGRADIDGSNPDPNFVTSGVTGPCGLAIDGTYVYWANGNSTTIGRTPLDDGTLANPNFVIGADKPCGVEVDGSHVYWDNFGTGGAGTTIGRADLDGILNKNQSFITGASGPCGLAALGGFLYWGNYGTSGGTNTTIGRALLGDSPIVDNNFITGNTNGPCGVAADFLAPLVSPVGSPKTPNNPTPEALASISRYAIDPNVFAAAEKGHAIATRARPVGTRVSYTDSQAAVTKFTVQRRTRGVKRGRRCLKRTARRRTGRRCIRFVPKGSFRHRDKAGRNSFRFTGRTLGRKLRPGRYRLRAVPRFAGRNGKARARRFRIIR